AGILLAALCVLGLPCVLLIARPRPQRGKLQRLSTNPLRGTGRCLPRGHKARTPARPPLPAWQDGSL
ncbi:MAG: hypothetical protein ACRDNW_06910, partial [Trebonia sp.]